MKKTLITSALIVLFTPTMFAFSCLGNFSQDFNDIYEEYQNNESYCTSKALAKSKCQEERELRFTSQLTELVDKLDDCLSLY